MTCERIIDGHPTPCEMRDIVKGDIFRTGVGGCVSPWWMAAKNAHCKTSRINPGQVVWGVKTQPFAVPDMF